MTKGGMNNFIGPALVELVSTLAISVGVSLIVAGALAVWSGRLLGLAPEHKLWTFIVGFAFLCSLSTVPISEPGTVVGYPVRRNGSGVGNFDLLPAKCSRNLQRPAKFERHLPHEPAFRLDDRRMDRSIVMDAAAVGKG
jgi:hypothetical protein